MYSDIVKLAKTTSESEILESELNSLLDAVYKTDGGLKSSLEKVREETARIFEGKMGKEGFKEDDIKNILAKLKERKVLKLTIAVDPTEEMIDEIYSWILANLGEDVVLDFGRDESVIGGAVVSFEGKFGDFSIKKILETR